MRQTVRIPSEPLAEPLHYTVEETLALLRISRSTLYELISEGQAPPSYNIKRRRFFPSKKLHQWLADR